MTTKRANELKMELEVLEVLKGFTVDVNRAYNFDTDKNDTEITFFKPLEGFDGICSNGNCIIESFFSIKELKKWLATLEETNSSEIVYKEFNNLIDNQDFNATEYNKYVEFLNVELKGNMFVLLEWLDDNNEKTPFERALINTLTTLCDNEKLSDVVDCFKLDKIKVATQPTEEEEEFYQERANTIATIEEINETYANIEKELEVKNAHETETVLENELSSDYTVKMNGCSFTINSRDKFYIQDEEGYTLYCGQLTESRNVFVKAITTIQEKTDGKFKTVFEVIRLARKHVYDRMIRKANKLKESGEPTALDTLTNEELTKGINLVLNHKLTTTKTVATIKPSYTLNSYIKDLKKEAIDYKIEYFLAKKKYYDNPTEKNRQVFNTILRDEKETIIELGICKQRKFLVKNYLDILKEF